MSLLDELNGGVEEEKEISTKKDLLPVQDAGDYVIVRDIKCVGADGDVFEYHKELWVPKDVERDEDNKLRWFFSPYEAIVHFEKKANDWFLPSAALTLNYVLKIFPEAVRKRSDGKYVTINEEFKKVLDKNYDSWYAQNSLIAYGAGEIIHYPGKIDFNSADASVDINANIDSIRLIFDRSELYGCHLSEGLKNKAIERFVRQFSGLTEPEKLVELGDYYGWLSGENQPTKIWFPWDGKRGRSFAKTRECWFGCDNGRFYLEADDYQGTLDAASGVRLR